MKELQHENTGVHRIACSLDGYTFSHPLSATQNSVSLVCCRAWGSEPARTPGPGPVDREQHFENWTILGEKVRTEALLGASQEGPVVPSEVRY